MIDSISSAANASADLKRTRRRKAAMKLEVDRLPPHALDMEMGTLGCAIIAPLICLPEIIKVLHGRTDAFYDLRNRTVFEALIVMFKSGDEIDTLTLHQHLKDNALLEEAGGSGYVSELANATPSAANLSYYLDKVQDKYLLRKIVHTCTDVVGRVYESEGDVDLLVDETRRDLERVFESRQKSNHERFTISQLDKFDLDNRSDNLVGNGYLTIGSSLITNGASGRGKSSLLMYRLMRWALGKDFYGMMPVRPLSFVVFQSENNMGDSAKTFQGARNYLKMDSDFNPEEFALLEKNIEIIYCRSLCGPEFLAFARQEILRRFADIAVIDPLVSFSDEDLNSARGAANFLRKGLDGISAETKVAWMINHHTPKPLRDPKNSKARKNVSDYQYGGAGSFDIPGWARAVETLEEASDGVFRFVIGKRFFESEATHPNGTRTSMIWLRHATEGGIHWEQADPPEETEESHQPKGGKPSIINQISGSNLYDFLSGCLDSGEGLNEIAKRLMAWQASHSEDVSIATCKRVIPLLVKSNKLSKDGESKYRKGSNA